MSPPPRSDPPGASLPDSPAPPADVDPSQLQEITGGEAEIMHDIVEEFASTADDLVAAIGASLTTRDARAAKRAAHTLKGSGGIIGAEGLRVRCVAIERAAAAGDLASVAAQLPALEEQRTTTLARLRELVAAAKKG